MIYFIGSQRRVFESTDIKESTISELLDYFSTSEYIECDLETEGYDPHNDKILSMQLGSNKDQFVIDWQFLSKDIILKIKGLLESGKLILFQNAQFDLRFLMLAGIDIKNIYDTFLAECLLTTGYDESNGRKLGLGDLAYKYCGVKLQKEIRGQIHWRGLDDVVIRYGANDVKYLNEIRKKQLVQIDKWNLNTILDIENKVVRVFAKMALDGIKLDPNKWEKVYRIAEANTKQLEEELDDILFNEPKLARFIPAGFQQNLFGFEERRLDINWSSPAQKLEILNALGLNVDSVGDRILQKNKRKHILVAKLIEYAKMSKLASAFGKNFLKFINKKTGRVHSSFWQILSTGRISVSDPNLNQIPSKGDLAKQIRAAFIPEDGYKIVGGDYSSFELAIIAEFSEDPLWINTLNEGKNLHTELCKVTFDIDDSQVKSKFPPKPTLTYRDVQKTVDFGLAYGMSHFKLSDTIDVSEKEAKDIIDKFFKAVPKVKQMLDKLGEFGKKHGYIMTPPPFNRIRWFPKWKGRNTSFKDLGEIERASKNMPIQGEFAPWLNSVNSGKTEMLILS
jgi:DNA polymerase-1